MQPPTPRVLPRFGRAPGVGEAAERPRRWQHRYRLYRLLLFLSLVVVIALARLANVEETARKRQVGTFVRSEELTPNDHRFKDGSGTFDMWQVELIPGQILRIKMTTSANTPYFFVMGPMSAASPEVFVRSEATFVGVAVAEFSPSQPGEYAVVVSSARGALGPYQLRTNYRVTDVLGTSDDEIEGTVEVLGALMIVFWLAQYYGLFTIPTWTHPDRILLLRPFGEPRVSRALKQFNRRSLAYRGFTFTLADKHLKHSLFVFLLANVPLDLGSIVAVLYRPLFRRMHRWVFIQHPRDLAILRLRLRSRWTLMRFWHSWLGLGDRINKFGSSDALWKDCIGILLDDCQVIVVDLSRAGAGTLWEVEELFRRGYGYKSLFMVRDDEDEARAARTLLEQINAAQENHSSQVPVLHRYGSADGRLLNTDAFDDAYRVAVSSHQQPQTIPLPISRKAVVAVAGMPLAPFWAPVGLPLALLALRDTRRAKGLLGGELLAHFAVAIYGALLIAAVVIAAYALLAR